MRRPRRTSTSGRPATLALDGPGIAVEVAPEAWEVLTAEDPARMCEACAGIGSPEVSLTLDGVAVPHDPKSRTSAGVGVALSRLDDIPDLRVLDVVILGLRDRQPSLLQTLLSNARTRARRCDQDAAARAVSGRTGLSRWVDEPAAALPPEVAALTDVTRALAAAPRAVIWCRPQWLDEEAQTQIVSALQAEQAALGFPVLEVRSAASADRSSPSTLPEP